jgi:hypothetical protein
MAAGFGADDFAAVWAGYPSLQLDTTGELAGSVRRILTEAIVRGRARA